MIMKKILCLFSLFVLSACVHFAHVEEQIIAQVFPCVEKAVNNGNNSCLTPGGEAKLFVLTNSSGASMELMNFGARIVKINMPDRNGNMEDVVVGPGSLDVFVKGPERYFGSIIGRYGNRIDKASFSLDGVSYSLVANENIDGEPIQCHGGDEGFDRFVWDSEVLREKDRVGVRFWRVSPDGEQGFPGNLDVSVVYWLTNDNVVKVEYSAMTDKPTVVNLSNHTFFNVKGASKNAYVQDLLFKVNADSTILNNSHFCPKKVLAVDGTPFDFKTLHRVDYRIDMPNEQLYLMKGMSACWCIKDWTGALQYAAELYDPICGRGLELWTTEPALLTFTGRTFDGSIEGKYGPIQKYSGMLLETIHFADSPNQMRFPSTVLRPGEKYYSSTEWRFFTR